MASTRSVFPAHAVGWFTVIWIQAVILPLIHFGRKVNYLTYHQRKTMDLLGTHALSAPIPICAGRILGAGSLPGMLCGPFRYSSQWIAIQSCLEALRPLLRYILPPGIPG